MSADIGIIGDYYVRYVGDQKLRETSSTTKWIWWI